jgi:hypothetical protein
LLNVFQPRFQELTMFDDINFVELTDELALVDRPSTETLNSHYVSNQAPLLANPLVKLPLGSIQADGWLKHQLDLMVDGMTGRLMEVSHFLDDDNGWFGTDKDGWEEQPYWFRGFYAMARQTGDERCLKVCEEWIEKVIATADEDGYYGPPCYKHVPSLDGKTQVTDLWPHMCMNDALILHYEYTGDERIIPLLKNFFKFCLALPEGEFIPALAEGIDIADEYGSWKITVQSPRASDMLPQVHWLYNVVKEDWLLDLATRFHVHTEPSHSEFLDPHIVNFTQRFSYAGLYYPQSKRPWHLEQTEYWYQQHMSVWGQQPRGIFGADECIRNRKYDPRQGFETCGMTEFAKSFYLLGRITGDCVYADRTEDVMLNHFPVSQTPDLKGLHYLTASNQVQLDSSDLHDHFNECQQLSYSPHEVYRCCQHNVAMGWPWYVDNLWQASADNGLVAWMYGASTVTAKVADGADVTIREETDYPFSGVIKLTVSADKSMTFPLYLRVPSWAAGFSLSINGEEVLGTDEEFGNGWYLRLEREFAEGDVIEVDFGMDVSLATWPRSGAVTVDRGPLSFSVKIGQEWRADEKAEGASATWPEWEVFPTTPWNYGLVMDGDVDFEVVEKGLKPGQPWTADNAPIEIKAKARKIPEWVMGENLTIDPLQISPIRCDGPDEDITLIPLGCAHLRVSVLPTIEDTPEARLWNDRRVPLPKERKKDAGAKTQPDQVD